MQRLLVKTSLPSGIEVWGDQLKNSLEISRSLLVGLISKVVLKVYKEKSID
jgi:hypothetical protein